MCRELLDFQIPKDFTVQAPYNIKSNQISSELIYRRYKVNTNIPRDYIQDQASVQYFKLKLKKIQIKWNIIQP